MDQQRFQLESPYPPRGDQPQAIDGLLAGLREGCRHQVLLGVTGSGKTYTLANAIQAWQRPTLVLAPNKTLAGQLFNEFSALFPHNAVEYFVSYFDYYQPEAYIPSTDTYIEKDSAINEQIDKLRHQATRSVLSRRDVIVVASVSAIYGIGSPENYGKSRLAIAVGDEITRDGACGRLSAMQYRRVVNEELERGTYRVIGRRLDVYPTYDELEALRVEFDGGRVASINQIDPYSGFVYKTLARVEIFPASHYIMSPETQATALTSIRSELSARLKELRALGRHAEADRLDQRTTQDIEMIRHLGFCSGIENYSRHLDGRAPGTHPATLLHYFPKDFLTIIDESHISVPQLRGMYEGDRSRKKTLVEYGFRLPSALDNRPLNFEEFLQTAGQIIYVSATPALYERQQAGSHVVEQIVRPTGLIDPEVHIFPARDQVDHLLAHIHDILKKKNRILALTLTKKMAESLSDFLLKLQIPSAYLHSDVKTLDRGKILDQFRRGDIEILVGINLLREGIDLPEVELVAIMDADKEGFLRSATALIQMMGRAARNIHGKVFVYADKMTASIRIALAETRRRRAFQEAYNHKHNITPASVSKPILKGLEARLSAIADGDEEFRHHEASDRATEKTDVDATLILPSDVRSRDTLIKKIKTFKARMRAAAQKLNFEEAQKIKDAIIELENVLIDL